MTVHAPCRAITRTGRRCRNPSRVACFCHRHSPQTRKSKLLAKAKTVAEVTAALGGILGLLEQLVEVWQSLPFGPSPAMPEDYEYLRAASGSRGWSDLPDRYVPSNRGGDSPATIRAG